MGYESIDIEIDLCVNKTDTWKVYKLQGAVSESFDLTPESFKAKIKS